MKKVLLILAGVAIAALCFWLAYCNKPVKEKITIRQLRELVAKGDTSISQKEYVVEGYLWNDQVPILVSDPKWLNVNTPMPDSSYILLSGQVFERYKNADYLGGKVRLQGSINFLKDPKGEIQGFDLRCPVPPVLLVKPKDLLWVQPFRLCERYPEVCRARDFYFVNKYAILYSGGISPVNAHRRYWNDLKFMYFTLRNKYGFLDSNIVVIYKNGTGEDADMPVDYAASPTGLNNAVAFLNGRMRNVDNLFLFITNHGGGWHRGGGHQGEATAGNRSGVADASPGGDEIDAQRYDETVFYYGQTNNTITDDTLASKINSLKFNRLVALLEPCFSGGLLYDLRGSKRFILSASDEFQFSFGGPTVDGASYDMFSYYFTEALNNATPGGTALTTGADTNSDGKVSILEAFLYAKGKDSAIESPQLEDTGDGVGTNSPSSASGDGVASNTNYL